MARKPSALSRELLRNFPKGRKGRNRRRRRKGDPQEAAATEEEVLTTLETPEETDGEPGIDKPGVPEEDVAEEGDYAADEDRTDADLDEPEGQSSVLAAAEAVEAAAEKPKRRRPP